MKKIFKPLILLICLLTPVITLANPTTRGIYLEATLGTVYVNETLFEDLTEAGGFGWNANLGYQFMKYVGAEAGFSHYTMAGSNNAYSTHIAVKGILPFTDEFNLFAKLGPAAIFPSNDNDTEWGLFYAFGASLALNDQLDITVQTSGVTQAFDTIGLVSAGLTYHFSS